MEQFDREDTSQFTDRQSQSGRVEQRPVAPAPKQKKSKAPWILSLLLLLALGAAASIGWLWYQQSGRVDNLEADLSVARNNVASLKSAAEAEEKLKEDGAIETEVEGPDSEAVIKAALAYMTAPVNPIGDNSREAKVEYLKNGFAKVVVKTSDVSPGGTSVAVMSFALTLKESQGDWIVLSAAEGPVADMDELMKTYGIPREAF